MLSKAYYETISFYEEGRNTQAPQWVCGDGHLKKYYNEPNGDRIKDSEGRDSFKYYGKYYTCTAKLRLGPVASLKNQYRHDADETIGFRNRQLFERRVVRRRRCMQRC